MVRYCDWPLNAMQFWGVGEFGKWCCFTVQNLGQVRKTMSLDYGRQYLNFAVFSVRGLSLLEHNCFEEQDVP